MSRPDSDVTIGSVWYVWGQHQEVTAQRDGLQCREVLLQPVNRAKRRGEHRPWVEAWRVQKWGRPSAAYA